MRAIRECAGLPLMWVQPKATQQRFELRGGDEVLAVMQWPSSWRSGSTVEAAEGSWSFHRQGFSQRVIIEVHRAGFLAPTLSRRWTGSATLSFPDGHAYLWKNAGFWGNRRAWTTPEGMPLIHFQTKYGFLKTGGEVTVDPLAAALPDLALLVSLGWYLTVMASRDAAAASSAVIS